MSKAVILGIVLGVAGPIPGAAAADGREPIVYTVRFPSPEKHAAEVEATIPTGGRPSIELMMAVWSPGFYRVEDYARKVEDLSARTPDGTPWRSKRPEEEPMADLGTGGAPRSSCRTGSPAIGGRSRRTGSATTWSS